MSKAVGMIETYGLIYAYEALDAMLKTANVELLSNDFVDGGIVMVTIQGDVGAVQASVEAGKDRVLEMQGQLLSAHVIPNIDETVHDQIFSKSKESKSSNVKLKNTTSKNSSRQKKSEKNSISEGGA